MKRKTVNRLLGWGLLLGIVAAVSIGYVMMMPSESQRREARRIEALYDEFTSAMSDNRWDQVLALDEKRRDLEQRYPSQWTPARCIVVASLAAVYALRGDAESARKLREQAHAMMVSSAAGSAANWGRTQHL